MPPVAFVAPRLVAGWRPPRLWARRPRLWWCRRAPGRGPPPARRQGRRLRRAPRRWHARRRRRRRLWPGQRPRIRERRAPATAGAHDAARRRLWLWRRRARRWPAQRPWRRHGRAWPWLRRRARLWCRRRRRRWSAAGAAPAAIWRPCQRTRVAAAAHGACEGKGAGRCTPHAELSLATPLLPIHAPVQAHHTPLPCGHNPPCVPHPPQLETRPSGGYGGRASPRDHSPRTGASPAGGSAWEPRRSSEGAAHGAAWRERERQEEEPFSPRSRSGANSPRCVIGLLWCFSAEPRGGEGWVHSPKAWSSRGSTAA